MSYAEIIDRRVRIFFLKALSNPKQIGPSTALGSADDGMGYDTLRLRTVRKMLNGSDHGFDDVLAEQLTVGEVRSSTKVKELIATVVTKSRPEVATTIKYEAKTGESVRLRLREMIARTAGVSDPATVLGTEPLSRYIHSADDRSRLKRALQSRLEKYLLGDIEDSDLATAQLINEVRHGLVQKMVL